MRIILNWFYRLSEADAIRLYSALNAALGAHQLPPGVVQVAGDHRDRAFVGRNRETDWCSVDDDGLPNRFRSARGVDVSIDSALRWNQAETGAAPRFGRA